MKIIAIIMITPAVLLTGYAFYQIGIKYSLITIGIILLSTLGNIGVGILISKDKK